MHENLVFSELQLEMPKQVWALELKGKKQKEKEIKLKTLCLK